MSTEEINVAGEIQPDIANIDQEDEFQSFGEFLTSQYELLKRTLSYLLIDDLGRAALVSRSWNKAATYLLKERELRSKIRWHLQCTGPDCDRFNCYKNDITFRSQLVLGFQLIKSNFQPGVIEEVSYHIYSPDGCKKIKIPGSKGHAFLIKSDKLEVPVSLPDKYSYRRNAALFFPHSDRFKIFSTLCFDEESLQNTISGEIDLQYGPLRGLLVFSQDKNMNFFDVVYNRLCHQFRQSIPLAGGIFPVVKYLQSGLWQSMERGLLVLGFHGNLDCYSGILSGRSKRDIEEFMKKMKCDIGGVDLQNQQRIAIVIRCIGRRHSKLEDDMFRKYFPDTPSFVLVSYGEYGNAGDSNDLDKIQDKIRATTANIYHSYSSVYFISTINVSPCRK